MTAEQETELRWIIDQEKAGVVNWILDGMELADKA